MRSRAALQDKALGRGISIQDGNLESAVGNGEGIS